MHIAVGGVVGRDDFTQEDAAVYPIPLTKFRVHDAVQTNLPGTAASDDLAIISGTLGSADPVLNSSDGKNTTVTQYARVQFPLPLEYEDGETVTIRVNAGMKTTVSSTTGAVDIQCYANGEGDDLCETAQTSCNSLTAADKDFTITSTSLVAGDVLDIRLKGTITDSGTGTAVIVEVNKVSVLLDVKG